MTPNDKELFNESLGHTPIEALAGGTVGFLTAAVMMFAF